MGSIPIRGMAYSITVITLDFGSGYHGSIPCRPMQYPHHDIIKHSPGVNMRKMIFSVALVGLVACSKTEEVAPDSTAADTAVAAPAATTDTLHTEGLAPVEVTAPATEAK